MKFHRQILAILWLLGGLGCAHQQVLQHSDWPRLPLLVVPAEGRSTKENATAGLAAQPWMQGDRKPPESIADLRLGNGPVRLVSKAHYFDGGSQAFLLEGEKGKFFAFCTSDPNDREKPAFLLGTFHFTQPGALRVEEGSTAFRFLYDLLWSFWDDPRNRPGDDRLRVTRESLGLSPAEFEKTLTKPTAR
jgi:hypothetical protein